jgi:hypothetical protein
VVKGKGLEPFLAVQRNDVRAKRQKSFLRSKIDFDHLAQKGGSAVFRCCNYGKGNENNPQRAHFPAVGSLRRFCYGKRMGGMAEVRIWSEE